MNGQGEHHNFVEGILARQAAVSGRQANNIIDKRDYCNLPVALTAKATFTKAQVLICSGALIVLLNIWILLPQTTVIVLFVLFSLFYLSVVLFRAYVLAVYDAETDEPVVSEPENFNERYVILSALYQEQNMIGDLLANLDRLRWSQGRKDVYLICEESDLATIAAIQAQDLPPGFHLIIVPDSPLKTKPRALNYALARVSGDYLVIYDAEDRPHRDQLLEAATRFRHSPKNLVCLQAPLDIDNRRESIITRLFAIEYATLFHGILPAIAHWKAPMPLGGTSNHFRMADLKQAGGWDSYNVTEDADLGIRLARLGKQCGVIYLPTREEAPASLVAWTRQRTRWIKGWLQTLLVHLRSPRATLKDMGWRNFLKFHMILTSVVVSVLVHPFFLAAFVFQVHDYFFGAVPTSYDIAITAISAFNLVAGYTTYMLLAFAVLSHRNYGLPRRWIALMSVYWLLISISGWRALYQLIIAPHHWEKTSHGSGARTQ